MSLGSMDRQPRVGLVGAGGLGEVWSKIIAADTKLQYVAIVDPLVGSGQQSEWLSDFSSVPHYASLDLAAAAGLDAVVVTAHSTVHAEILRDALGRGLHVLVEKPFTTTYADAEALVALAAEKNLTLMVSQNYRYFPGAAMIREIVADGRYGKVVSVFGEFWCDWAGKPYQHKMQHVMGLEMAVHHFDLCRAMFDGEPAGGYVREWQQANSQYAGGGGIECLFDIKSAGGNFPFTYSGSLVGKAPRTPWPGLWRIEFDTETLVVDTIDGRYGVFRADADGFEWLGRFDGDDMLFNLPLSHFLKSIRLGKEPWSSGRDNLGTLKMALGAEFFGRP